MRSVLPQPADPGGGQHRHDDSCRNAPAQRFARRHRTGVFGHRHWPAGLLGFLDPGDETVALGMHRSQVAWVRGIVVQRLAQPGHGLAERGFADHRVAPHGVHQLLPRHEPVAVGNQVDEELQHDRLEMHLFAIPAKQERLGVDHEVIETVNVMLAHELHADIFMRRR